MGDKEDGAMARMKKALHLWAKQMSETTAQIFA